MLFDPKLVFWKVGARVRVQIGDGADAGRLRITPGERFTLAQMGGNSGAGAVSLIIPAPPGTNTGDRRPKQAVEFDYDTDWLEVTLPDWARAPAPRVEAAAPPPRVVAAAPGNGVFRTAATVNPPPPGALGARR